MKAHMYTHRKSKMEIWMLKMFIVLAPFVCIQYSLSVMFRFYFLFLILHLLTSAHIVFGCRVYHAKPASRCKFKLCKIVSLTEGTRKKVLRMRWQKKYVLCYRIENKCAITFKKNEMNLYKMFGSTWNLCFPLEIYFFNLCFSPNRLTLPKCHR